ncbi:MAG: hypothetical protein JO270_19025 [Acidobacteriaceae bacterium]|nr:hypothetical protein [Acidobacteriaceae bacterium]MBV8569931.1 hypothetical protein [Acidobacteriaceae bacterium]
MEPSVETFVPSRLYSRVGWAALAGSVVCVLCGLRAPLAFIPGVLCAGTAAALFWLAARPAVRIGDTQFNIGERAIAWREVREVNTSRFLSPLVVKIQLTNARRRVLIYPGEPERIEKLLFQLRKNSQFATFDGVAYRDYWTWLSMNGSRSETPVLEQPVRMLSPEEEDEIERMYQKLKTVGRLDTRVQDSSDSSDED